MRIIPNQSEKLFVSRLMKNGKKSIRSHPIQSEATIRMNPKPSFQSKLRLIQTEFSIRIKPNHFDRGFIRIDSDWKFGLDQSELGLKTWFRIHSDSCLGLNQISSDRFFIVFYQTRCKKFFGLVRKDSHWLGFRYRNESE